MYTFSLPSAIIILAILPRKNLVLAQAENVAVEGDLIDLYVYRSARNWTNYRVFGDDVGNFTGRPSYCPVVGCDGGVIAEDCIPRTEFWPGNVCMRNDPRVMLPTVLYRRTTDPDKISEGFTMEKCYFSDLECSEANRIGDCLGFKVDSCSSSSSSSNNNRLVIEVKKLQDWCMVGTEPRGDFIVPLIRGREFLSWRSNTALDCATAPYEEKFVPVDPQLCVANRIREGNQVTLGSFRLICNDDGSVTSERWDDTVCMGSKASLYEPVGTIPGSCPANGVIEAGVPFFYYPSCAAPSMFCKDIAGILPSFTRQATLRPTLDDQMPVNQGPIVSQTPPPVDEALPGGISVPATLKPSTTTPPTTPPKEINNAKNLVVRPTSGLHEGAQRPNPWALKYVVENVRRPSKNSLRASSF